MPCPRADRVGYDCRKKSIKVEEEEEAENTAYQNLDEEHPVESRAISQGRCREGARHGEEARGSCRSAPSSWHQFGCVSDECYPLRCTSCSSRTTDGKCMTVDLVGARHHDAHVRSPTPEFRLRPVNAAWFPRLPQTYIRTKANFQVATLNLRRLRRDQRPAIAIARRCSSTRRIQSHSRAG